MKRFSFFLFASLAALHISLASAGTGLPEAQRRAMLNASHWREIPAAAMLPPALAGLFADEDGKLADPGQPWDAGCTPRHLPRHRLEWAVSSGKYYVVQYASGGYATYRHVLIATLPLRTRKPLVLWRGADIEAFKDYKAFLAALQSGDLAHRLEPEPLQ